VLVSAPGKVTEHTAKLSKEHQHCPDTSQEASSGDNIFYFWRKTLPSYTTDVHIKILSWCSESPYN